MPLSLEAWLIGIGLLLSAGCFLGTATGSLPDRIGNMETHLEVTPITRRFLKWNPMTQQHDRRGGPICCICGGQTRSVLDGEAWCERCGTYQ